MRNAWAIAALAGSSFSYVTVETLPVGLLPEIADGLEVSESRTGLLVTVYALVVALSTIPLTALTARLDRRLLLVSLVGLLAISQIMAAMASSFVVLALARMACALAHGVFWAILVPAAARLVPPERLARVTALVFLGNTMGLAIGLPAATAFGQSFGWRASFVLMAGLGAASCALLLVLLPPMPADREPRGPAVPVTAEPLAALGSRAVLTVCAATVLIVVGQFVAYTYFAPLTHLSASSAGYWASVFLLVYGFGGVAGTAIVGPLADRRPGPALTGSVVLVLVAYALLLAGWGPAGVCIAVFAWGVGFPAATVVLQAGVLRAGGDGPARDGASAAYVVAFQIGISAGAFAGELLTAGGQLSRLPVAGAVVLGAALMVVVARPRVFPRQLPTPALHGPATGS